jgi:hypothetical protein
VELKGERVLPVSRESAWQLLNDAAVLEKCVPGCESMTARGEHDYDVVMTAAIGPVKARFKGKLSVRDLDPPRSYRLLFEGQSAQAGFARGEARVELVELAARETRLIYGATAQIGGKLAQIGARLIDAAGAATAERFFQSFAAQLAARTGAGGAAAGAAAAPAAASGLWGWLKSFLKHLWTR